MSDKGQITVYVSLMITALLVFTLGAIEITRIHMGRVKVRACTHSMRSSIMADYYGTLFERYHLLFMDPTYGTGSDAVMEMKIEDYLEASLNGATRWDTGVYSFSIDEVAGVDKKYILDNQLQQVREQVVEYEKTVAVINQLRDTYSRFTNPSQNYDEAVQETETNGVEQPETEPSQEVQGDTQEDPRSALERAVSFGTLAFVMPGNTISRTTRDFGQAPSSLYRDHEAENNALNFWDIGLWKQWLRQRNEAEPQGMLEQPLESLYFADYVTHHFTMGAKRTEGSVMDCEAEYILKGRDNDYENLQSVVNDIIGMRVPINYAYLLQDGGKQGEALAMATALCSAAGAPELGEIVKYLLLGCWAYGESLYEVKGLLAGGKIAYVKTSENWNSSLANLVEGGTVKEVEQGMTYENYITLFLAQKTGRRRDSSYARMLDVMELNIRQEDPDFQMCRLVGGMTIQGRVVTNSVFPLGINESVYSTYFEESFSY